jgi:hypothetical protein
MLAGEEGPRQARDEIVVALPIYYGSRPCTVKMCRSRRFI